MHRDDTHLVRHSILIWYHFFRSQNIHPPTTNCNSSFTRTCHNRFIFKPLVLLGPFFTSLDIQDIITTKTVLILGLTCRLCCSSSNRKVSLADITHHRSIHSSTLDVTFYLKFGLFLFYRLLCCAFDTRTTHNDKPREHDSRTIDHRHQQ